MWISNSLGFMGGRGIMKLDFEWFISEVDFIRFVNKTGIKKENIQAIVPKADGYTVFYWKEEE